MEPFVAMNEFNSVFYLLSCFRLLLFPSPCHFHRVHLHRIIVFIWVTIISNLLNFLPFYFLYIDLFYFLSFYTLVFLLLHIIVFIGVKTLKEFSRCVIPSRTTFGGGSESGLDEDPGIASTVRSVLAPTSLWLSAARNAQKVWFLLQIGIFS